MRRAVLVFLAFASPAGLWAHCDRADGPVAAAARAALEQQQPELVLAWVAADQDQELRETYDLAIRARAQGGAGAELAERFLVETAIRLHRQAEGLAFEGVKPAAGPLPGDIALADRALASGNVDAVVAMLQAEIEREVRELFEALEAQQMNRQGALEARRSWVDAYVRYVGFIHGLDTAIKAGPEHGVGHAD